jgi:hypothetical protein
LTDLTATIVKETYASSGNKAQVWIDLPAVSDGDTVKVREWDVIDHAIVHARGTAAVAADSVCVASISGNTVTFQVDGTARTATLVAVGY